MQTSVFDKKCKLTSIFSIYEDLWYRKVLQKIRLYDLHIKIRDVLIWVEPLKDFRWLLLYGDGSPALWYTSDYHSPGHQDNHSPLSSSFWNFEIYNQSSLLFSSLPLFTSDIPWSHRVAQVRDGWGAKPISRRAPGTWQFWSQVSWGQRLWIIQLNTDLTESLLKAWSLH